MDDDDMYTMHNIYVLTLVVSHNHEVYLLINIILY